MHGYDIMKDVKAGGSVTFDFPATIEGDLRGRARGPQGADPRADGQPVSLLQVLPLAHALVARKDLPIPAWLFAWGASIVLIVSFFALSAAWREPRFEEERWRPLGAGLSRALLGLPAQVLCGAIGVFLLGVSIYAGLHGTEAPDRNFAITFLFVTAWLGFPVLSVVFGNVFKPFNPWRAIGRVAGGGFRAIAGQRFAHLRLPRAPRPLAGRDRPGRLRLAGDRLRRQRRRRRRLSTARGRRRRPRLQRLHAGDDGPLRGRGVVRAGRGLLGLLRDVLAARLLRGQRRAARACGGRSRRRRSWATVPGSAAVVIASIATTSFDGAQEGAFKGAIESTFDWLARPRRRPDHGAAPHRHDLHGARLRSASASST